MTDTASKPEVNDLLQLVAISLAGEGGCCGDLDDDGRCCMTGNAQDIFDTIEAQTGVTLDQLDDEMFKKYATVKP
jgi:hypothetical protein